MKRVLICFFIIIKVVNCQIDTLKLGNVYNIVVDTEENLIFTKNENNVISLFKMLSKYSYDSVLVLTSVDNVPFAGDLYYEVNTRQEIYILDKINQRIVILSKDLRPLTVIFREDIVGFPGYEIVEDFSVNNSGYMFLRAGDKLFIVNNFQEVINEIEIEEEVSKILYWEVNNYIVAEDKDGIYFYSLDGNRIQSILFNKSFSIKKCGSNILVVTEDSIDLITGGMEVLKVFEGNNIVDGYIFGGKLYVVDLSGNLFIFVL